LKAADQRLVDARKAFQDEATTVANATRSGFSFTGTQFADSADLIGSLSSSVNQAGTFSRDLAALRKRHAAKSIVQQLAEAGAGSAGTTAHTLATASASDLRRINGLNSQLGVFSNAIGQGEARQLFGAGVASAKGFATVSSRSFHGSSRRRRRWRRRLSGRSAPTWGFIPRRG
jgi:hypothetical protein